MPGPPTTIHIKRKATDDPVELLHVQNEVNGLLGSRQYVFKRQKTVRAPGNDGFGATQPAIAPVPEAPASHTQPPPPRHIQPQPRRFHLFRDGNAQSIPGDSGRSTPTVFIEQRTPPAIPPLTGHNTIAPPVATPPIPSPPPPTPASPFTSRPSSSRSANAPKDVDPLTAAMQAYSMAEDRKLALSSANVRPPRPRSPPPGPLLKPKRATGKIKPRPQPQHSPRPARFYNPSAGELGAVVASERRGAAAAGDREEGGLLQSRRRDEERNGNGIGNGIEQHEDTDMMDTTPVNSAPEIHIATDHPQHQHGDQHEDEAHDHDHDSDGDYIIDTYIRLPAELFLTLAPTPTSGGGAPHPPSTGLLVLSTTSDLDTFYGENADSDSEAYDDADEDSNAENHPSTDYPEDEVASDDEFGRGAYTYRRGGGASDEEEWDVTVADADEGERGVTKGGMGVGMGMGAREDEEDEEDRLERRRRAFLGGWREADFEDGGSESDY